MVDLEISKFSDLCEQATHCSFSAQYGLAIPKLEEIIRIGETDALLARDPRVFAAHWNLGLIYDDIGWHRGAIEHLRKGISSIDSEDARTYYGYRALAGSLFLERQYEESIEPLEKVLRLNEKDFVMLLFLGIAYVKRCESTREPECLRRAREIQATLKSQRLDLVVYLERCLASL